MFIEEFGFAVERYDATYFAAHGPIADGQFRRFLQNVAHGAVENGKLLKKDPLEQLLDITVQGARTAFRDRAIFSEYKCVGSRHV